MKKPKQLPLFPNQTKKFFGGALLYKKRKSRRPLSKKDSIHLVLRSEWAMGTESFLAKRNHQAIKLILVRFSKRFGVKIYQQAITSNHIHLLLRITNRPLYKGFIKAISGQIASHTMGQQSFKVFKSARTNMTAGDGSTALVNSRRIKGSGALGDKVANTGVTVATIHQTPEGFWQFRPFSRITNWGRDFKKCIGYLKQNVLEAFGFVNYKPRKNYYAAWIRHAAPVFESE